MKRFNDLNDSQKKEAVEKSLNDLVNSIIQDGLVPGDFEMVAKIDCAMEKAESMQTPWFAAEYLFDDNSIKGYLVSLATEAAESAWYPEQCDNVVRINLV